MNELSKKEKKLEARARLEELVTPHRTHLRTIKKVSRADEMDLDRHIDSLSARHQFLRDVRLYNLYEALLMSWNYPGDSVALANHILANHGIR